MVKIVTFPGRSEKGSVGDFLQDGGDTLSFDNAGEGIVLPDLMNRLSEEAPSAPSSRDWSNQELADLFRVKRLLDSAGVPNEIDRGVTDEGDPWFIFCGHDQEVFIHLCRIDGLYLLDSPNLRQPLTGFDFNELIATFSDRALPSDQVSDRKVIKLERGGKVFLHPSALLAALIWTLYIASEELVLLAPETEGGIDEGLDLVAASARAHTAGERLALDTLQDADDDLVAAADGAYDHDGVADRAHIFDGHIKANLAMAPNTYAIGLSAIAIAMGVMSEGSFTDVFDTPAEIFFAVLDGVETAAEDTGSDADDKLSTNHDLSLSDMFDKVLDIMADATGDEADEPLSTDAPDAMFADAQAFIDSLKAVSLKELSIDVASVAPDGAGQDIPDVEFAQATTRPKKTEAPDAPAQTASAEKDDGLVDVAKPAEFKPIITLAMIHNALGDSVKDFSLGGSTFQANFDLTTDFLQDVGLADDGSASLDDDVLIPMDPVGQQDIDLVKFQNLLTDMLSRIEDLQMVSNANTLVLIDQGADGLAGGQIYSMSWEMSDGSVISLLGQKSMFEDYHLVA